MTDRTLPHPADRFRTGGTSLRAVRAVALMLAAAMALPAAAEQSSHVITTLRSASETQSDLRYMVSDLAGESASYDDLVGPFIETLLFGVETGEPLRFDAVLSDEETYRLLLALPLTDVDEFIEDNLQPVNIDARRKRRSRDTYDLRGNVYEGVMKVVKQGRSEYALIAKTADDVETAARLAPVPTVASPLLENGRWDAALHIGPESGSPELRAKITAAMKARGLDKLSRKADETPAAFNLRKVLAGHRFDRLGRLVGGVTSLDMKMVLDQKASESRSQLVLVPAAGTELAGNFDRIGTQPYPFSGVPTNDAAVMSARLQWAMTDSRRERMRESLEAARPVATEQIDASSGTADQKAARKQLSDLIYDQLTDGTTADTVDLFGEITGSGPYTLVGGATVASTKRVGEMLDLFPQATPGATVERNVSELTTGGGQAIAVHKVTLPDLPASLQTFVGTQTGLVGIGETMVFAAAGPDAETQLKAALAAIDGPGATTNQVMSLRMHAAPMAKLANDVLSSNDASLINFLQQRRQQRGTARSDRKVQVGNPEVYRQVMVDALQSGNDVIELMLGKDGNQLLGAGRAESAVLKAIGEVMARFSEDNLR